MISKPSCTDFFPYPEPRKGQGEMMAKIEEAVRAGTNICAEAPNGFGKTCATLSGVLPWVKEKKGKVLYCARTHRQLDRVVEEMGAILDKVDVSGISFRGRRHMCVNQFVLENADLVAPISEVCGHLKTSGRCVFYENLKQAGSPSDLLDEMPGKVLTALDIVETAKARSLCPYELAKKLAKVVDVVALSYLYVFDPWILEAFLPELETPMAKIVLVQDEAHNVPSTALDSASDSLAVGSVRQAMREATTYNDTPSKDFCRGLAKSILEQASGLGANDEIVVDPGSIYDYAFHLSGLDEHLNILAHMKDLGYKIKRGLLKAGKFPRSSIYRVADFMLRWMELVDQTDYAFFLASSVKTGESRRISLDLVALDPTAVTSPILRLTHSSVAVSGTISPLDAYSEMLGFGQEAIRQAFSNPFSAQNRLCFIVEGLDTSYSARTDSMFQRMVNHCVAVAHSTPGNTGIFATSYGVAKQLLDAGLESRLKMKLFEEKPNMKGSENDRLVEDFKRMGTRGGAVLLGVQGGRNSEGGDFPGPSMESAVVVGVPYARPTPRSDALIKYYDYRFNQKGRDYAYVLPAMTRAIQAAGRPVRKLDDKGVIVLLDQRFATPYLRRFIPSWIDEIVQVVPDNPDMIAQHVEAFFSS
ncbi:MAG: ATP-dependent DNA helicase [Candidatus Thorarchaeota archaeon]|nr:ATP-dependent DNA helicase [Candidatus Thorarchaeota archaeon]